MDVMARMSSKGQLTIPKAVRDALGLKEGDAVIFRVEGTCAVMTRPRDFLELAGSVAVPPGKEDASWEEIIDETWTERAPTRR